MTKTKIGPYDELEDTPNEQIARDVYNALKDWERARRRGETVKGAIQGRENICNWLDQLVKETEVERVPKFGIERSTVL